ncbi:MAG: 30S ribosomal protein S8e [Candidatus Nanoarchaeia archaeon]
MVIVQNRSLRKNSGGRYGKLYRGKRKYEIGRAPAMTTVGEQKTKTYRTKGAGSKTKMVGAAKANVYNPKTKKCQLADIKATIESTANLHFVRRNVITKGAVIETSAGKAKVTSRPGQDGAVNAVLI